ncbi:hypothetical protein D3C76_1437530 [compost metagenome]
MGLRVGQRQLLHHLFPGGLAAGKLVGITNRAEVFIHIAVMVIIKVNRRRRNMNEPFHTVGRSPFPQTAGSADVGQFEGFFCTPWGSETGAVPQHIHIRQHGFGLR